MKTVGAGRPTLADLFVVFLKIGLLSFGGPAAQIALMHRVLVDERGWLSERQFLNALSFCMLLPGPEAMQLATYCGWRLQGVRGGLIAGLLFVLPGAIVIFALALLYVSYADLTIVGQLFVGVQAVAVVIVVEALLRVSKKALVGRVHWVLAGGAFVGIFFLAIPFPAIVLGAGLLGALMARRPQPDEPVGRPQISTGRSLQTVFLGVAIWLLPLVALDLVFDLSILTEIGVFFSKLAVVTFGGAYAVLAYMAQDIVTQLGWLTPTQMMDGLGLAETTPGPLILVTQFVGVLAAHAEGGIMLGLAGGAVALWVTFVPCFIWIFLGAPYLDWISAQPRLNGALRAITAAVVGVMLNLSLWFALHVVFEHIETRRFGVINILVPDPASLDLAAVGLICVGSYLLFRRHLGIGWVLLVSACLAGVVA